MSFDLERDALTMPCSSQVTFRAASIVAKGNDGGDDGDAVTCNAVAWWFDCELDEQTSLSNAPPRVRRRDAPITHWAQAVALIAPRRVAPSSVVIARITTDGRALRWSFDGERSTTTTSATPSSHSLLTTTTTVWRRREAACEAARAALAQRVALLARSSPLRLASLQVLVVYVSFDTWNLLVCGFY